MKLLSKISTHKFFGPISVKFFLSIIASTAYSSLFFGQLEAQTVKQVKVCSGNRQILVTSSSSKATMKALKMAAKRGKVSLPISRATGKAIQGGCSRRDRQSGTVQHIKLKSFDLSNFDTLLKQLLAGIGLSGIPDTSGSLANTLDNEQSEEITMMSAFPPAPSDTHPASMPRTVRTFLQNRQFTELGGWTYDINKDLVLALSKGVNLYTIGGDDASPVDGFCYECLAAGEHTILRSSAGLSSLTAGISKASSGQAYTSVVSAMTGGVPVSFDSSGRLSITINGRSANLSVGELQDSQYDYLSNGQPAQFFTISNGSGIQQYTWRYLTLASTRRNLGVLITPVGGLSALGNYEGSFIDFQATSPGSAVRSVNPIEYYFGTRYDSVLGVSRVDVSMVFPYGVRLRTTNVLGQQVRVQYSGILSGLVTLPLVTGNPARIDESIVQNFLNR